MTEREKMLAGELYLASDPELVSARTRCRVLTGQYNQSSPEDPAKRDELLRRLFGTLGQKPCIEPPLHCDYGSNIHAGDSLYMNFNCVILDCAKVTLGSNVLLGPGVQIYAGYHPIDPVIRLSGAELAGPVTIGDNVWIGGGVIICPGVSIGNNCVIGAGSLVTKSLPADVVAYGSPAREIRSVYTPQKRRKF